MKELFDTADVSLLSPYREWERHNRIKTHYNRNMEEPWIASRTIKDCFHSTYGNGDQYSAYGITRDEAIANLCAKLGIPVFGESEK